MLSTNILERIRSFILDRDDFYIVSHYDTDGLCSLYIFINILNHLGKKYKYKIVKGIDEENLKELNDNVVFLDLGSGYIDIIKKHLMEENFLIVDHHKIRGKTKYHFNPYLVGIDGSREISGAGTVNLLANSFGLDFSDISLIGAAGDLQMPFVGKNSNFLRKSSVLKKKDILIFGRYSRKLPHFLYGSHNPYLPGITGNIRNTTTFLNSIGLSEYKNYRYCDLEIKERKILLNGLIKYLYKRNFLDKVELIGTVYDNIYYDLVDLREISFVVNSCGRHGYYEEGLKYLETGNSKSIKNILNEHKKILKRCLDFAKDNLYIKNNICILDGTEVIPDSVIGIICSYLLKTHNKLIVGFAKTENEKIKVSIRNPFDHIDIGKFLSENFETGGGHKQAGGCVIKEDEKEILIKKIEKII